QVEHADTAGEVDQAIAVGIPDHRVFSNVGKLGRGACSTAGDVALLEFIELCVIHDVLLQERRAVSHRPPTQTYFSSVYSSRPWREPSRPSPDSLTPPKG